MSLIWMWWEGPERVGHYLSSPRSGRPDPGYGPRPPFVLSPHDPTEEQGDVSVSGSGALGPGDLDPGGRCPPGSG